MNINITEKYSCFLTSLKTEFPHVRIELSKNVWWKKCLDEWFLKKSDGTFTTTLFNTIAVPNDFHYWTESTKYEVLMHEREHLRQYKRYSLGTKNIIFGAIIMGILYLFCLPTIFTMRSHFEKQAYEMSARAMIECECGDRKNWFVNWMAKTFCGWEYVWMCPFKHHIEKWAAKVWDRNYKKWHKEEGVNHGE